MAVNFSARAARGEEPGKALPQQIRDFKTSALVSLSRTPQLQRSNMEIDIRRLDEDDSRWSYFPELKLSSHYYVSEDEATISFHAENYRPWEPYYNLQARQLITQIVMLNHVQATAQALQKLADSFLEFVALAQIDRFYKEIVGLYEKQLRYVEQRHKSDMVTAMELELEKQTMAFIIAESQANAAQSEALVSGWCISMDLPDPGIFDLDSSLVLSQVLGSSKLPEPEDMSLPEQSIDQQIMIKRQLLQEKKILLAYSKYMPDFSVGVRSPDVLNVSIQDDKDYFLYVGMSLTLWDGNKRARDITRQEMLLRQLHLEGKEIENNESLEWLKATRQYSSAKSEYNLSQSVEKLNQLQLKKKEFEYNRGSIRLPELINHQILLRREKISTIRKELALNRAVLQLRYLSGQLLKDTVNISLSDMPYE